MFQRCVGVETTLELRLAWCEPARDIQLQKPSLNCILSQMRRMYAIFTHIYHRFKPNVGKYSIHGASGFGDVFSFARDLFSGFMLLFLVNLYQPKIFMVVSSSWETSKHTPPES